MEFLRKYKWLLLLPASGGILWFGMVYVKDYIPEKSFSVKNKVFEEEIIIEEDVGPEFGISTVAGLDCEYYNRRPFAMMLSADPETRPLSGIGSADLVFEMAAITNSITRFMAVFQCDIPHDIGSMRSARHDFIPLAGSVDAIFVHWGGSHYALNRLSRDVIDNINALANPFDAFYRKLTIWAPHNGFTSKDRLLRAARGLEYRMETEFEGYPRLAVDEPSFLNTQALLEILYVFPFNVRYEYFPEENVYLRWRGNTPEIDKLTNQQVKTKNIVVMKARSRPIEGQYNDVDIEGEGEVLVYRNGEEITGTWEKSKDSNVSKLYFLDEAGEEIEFVPGSIWVQVVEPYQEVSWTVSNINISEDTN